MIKVLIIGGNTLAAAALAAALGNAHAEVVMPSRRPELDPGYDMNDLIDMEPKGARKKARKERLKAAQARAFGS